MSIPEDRLECNKKNKVLVRLPQGKHSLTAPNEISRIPSQKGPTCWYYSLKFLSPRFGDAAIHHPKERQHEKALSHFRKQCTTLSAETGRLEAWVDVFMSELSSDISPQRGLKLLEILLTSELCSEAESFKILFSKFTPVTHSDIKQCLIKNEEQRTIKAAKLCIRTIKGRTNPYLNSYKDLLASRGVCLQGLAFYMSAVGNLMVESNHLSYSDWMPKHSIDRLISEIKQLGALRVVGKIGIPYYQGDEQCKTHKLGSKAIHFWAKGSYAPSDSDPLHAILIVGAEKSKTKGELVYFIDPNSSSDEYDHVYCMSYKLLCKQARNIHCSPGAKMGLDQFDSRAPFAIAANQSYQNECEQAYMPVEEPSEEVKYE